jgi:hypothetical protein
MKPSERCNMQINPLNAELNPICHLLALLGTHHILHVSRIRVKKFKLYVTKNVGWDCVVCTVTHCGLDSPGIKSWCA